MDQKSDDGAPSSNRSTKAALLRAACEAMGGVSALAARLEISEAMLRKYASGAFEMADPLFLRAVDVLLEERERRYEWAAAPAPALKAAPDGRADA